MATVDDSPFGLIYLQHPDREAFNDATVLLLVGAADMAAPALANALEREWLRAENERLRAENEAELRDRTMLGTGAKMKKVRRPSRTWLPPTSPF